MPTSKAEFKSYTQKVQLQAFGDASKVSVCAAVYSIAHQSDEIFNAYLAQSCKWQRKILRSKARTCNMAHFS